MVAPALALILALASGTTYPHHRRVLQPSLPHAHGTTVTPVLQLLAGPIASGSQCTGSTITSVTFARSGAQTCTKADGTVVALTSNQPALEANGLHIEASGINSLLQSRDLSNASWTKSSMTCAKTATGTDGVANSASTCTSSAGNATVLQGITASGTRTTSLYLRRNSGAGTVQVTRDNGTTWTAVTLTISWQRFGPFHSGVTALTSSTTNPTVGVRLVTNGDAVDVDRVQDEAGSFESSPIDTTTTAATRNATAASTTTPASLVSNNEGCIQTDIWMDGPAVSGANRVVSFSSSGRTPLVAQSVTMTGFFDGTNNYALSHPSASAQSTTLHVFSGWRSSDSTGYVGAAGVKCSAGCVNGGGTPGAYTGTQFTGTTLYLGSSVGSGSFLGGYILNLAVYAAKDSCS